MGNLTAVKEVLGGWGEEFMKGWQKEEEGEVPDSWFPKGILNQKDGFLKKKSKEVPLSHFVDVAYMILKQQLTNIDNLIVINMLHFRSCTVALTDVYVYWPK